MLATTAQTGLRGSADSFELSLLVDATSMNKLAHNMITSYDLYQTLQQWCTSERCGVWSCIGSGIFDADQKLFISYDKYEYF